MGGAVVSARRGTCYARLSAEREDRSIEQPKLKPLKQVAALPVKLHEDGRFRVLLITSRETKRLIIPKGWPMKGHHDHRAAAIEAQQEAGLIGRIHRKPIGSYTYWKRRKDHFDYCSVDVFVLEVEHQLTDWLENGQREALWLPLDDAADLVSDAGLVTLIRDLPSVLARRRFRKSGAKAGPSEEPRR
jgi:8-oxo-dGTP pyrophosphatase MutT (NUDIX family)